MADSEGAAQLDEAAAIVAELCGRHPELGDRFGRLAGQLDELATTQLAGSPMVLPLTAPIRRNAVNLREATGDRFRTGVRSLEEQVANLQRRAAEWGRSGGG